MPQFHDPLLDEDSDYASSEDSNFAPDEVPQAAGSGSSDSDSESEAENDTDDVKSAKEQKIKGVTRTVKRKRDKIEGAEDVGFENSGDEEIVEKGLKRRRKRGKKSNEDEDDDGEGGEGGFVRTRRMAMLAWVAQVQVYTDWRNADLGRAEEKRPLASTTGATVDVDAIWASMTSGAPGGILPDIANVSDANEAANTDSSRKRESPSDDNRTTIADMPSTSTEGEPDDMVIIQRTYNFAGKVHTEEKLVARDSAEARLWLQSQSSKDHSQPGDSKFSKPLRPPKKARRSIFEPIIDPLPQRTDLRFGASANSNRQTGRPVNAKKLNTVEKSKMDWAGFVDKEGIKDELEMAGKARGSYMNQTEFLARVEEKREEEARKARLKTVSWYPIYILEPNL
jgi:hypothetical protein